MTRLKHSSAQTRRCSWVNADDVLVVEYHDREWGIPAHSDHKHFEVLILSGVQAGLNWSLVLQKRDGYRRAFNKFDPEKVARYPDSSAFARIREAKQGPQAARIQLCGPDRDVCLHAGDRNGERSHCGLLPLSGNRSRVCR